MYRVALVLLAALSGSYSQLLINGTCPILSGSMAANNYQLILGNWYQIQRIANNEEGGDCATTFFGGGVTAESISNREVRSGTVTYLNGTITLVPNQPHRFTVSFPNIPGAKDYYLIGTDFTNYALIGRCDVSNLANNATQTSLFAWKLSRNTALSPANNTAINALLSSIPQLANTSWRTVSHTSQACRSNGAGSVASSLMLVVTALLLAVKENY